MNQCSGNLQDGKDGEGQYVDRGPADCWYSTTREQFSPRDILVDVLTRSEETTT
jgi:hypothetical protein